MLAIQKATFADLTILQQLATQTFRETYAAQNTPAQMDTYIYDHFSDEQLRAELKNPASAFYILFEQNEPKNESKNDAKNDAIAYLKINFAAAQTELNDPKSLEIERIYVLKTHHGQNIGKILYEYAFAIAQQHRLEYIWLGVWEHNPRAIRFYEKMGFQIFGTHIFDFNGDPQTDFLMRLFVGS
jgi:diamine N-acetyltransferase